MSTRIPNKSPIHDELNELRTSVSNMLEHLYLVGLGLEDAEPDETLWAAYNGLNYELLSVNWHLRAIEQNEAEPGELPSPPDPMTAAFELIEAQAQRLHGAGVDLQFARGVLTTFSSKLLTAARASWGLPSLDDAPAAETKSEAAK